MKHPLIKFLPLFLTIIVFLIIKVSNLAIRLSDTNIYFYTAYQLLHGKLLYKDIFFTNFPLFPYLSSLYFLIFQGNLKWFYITSSLEVIGVTVLIYHIVYKKTKQTLPAFISSILYLFSFIVLSTSDHQTGVFSASLFIVGSYLFLDKKKYKISGALTSLTLLTKAYFIVIPASFIAYLIIKKKYKALALFISGALLTTIIIILPSLIFSREEFFKDIFSYSLTRGAGTIKAEIAWFFITHDPVLFILLLFNLFHFKKNLLFSLISFFSLIFFFTYQDIYYLYLNFIVPFLAISFSGFYLFLQQKMPTQKFFIPTIIIIFLSFNFFVYLSSFKDLQKPQNLYILTQAIKKEKPPYLYGTNDLAPALAYLTNTRLVNNTIDTNENIFRKGFLDARKLTQKAIAQKAILISHGAYYPTAGVQEDMLDGIFEKTLVKKHCKLINRFPAKAEGIVNSISLFRCF